jgi:hypothetical protein
MGTAEVIANINIEPYAPPQCDHLPRSGFYGREQPDTD